MQTLANWVMKFDPRSYLRHSDYAAEMLTDSADEAVFKDFTQQVLSGVDTSKPQYSRAVNSNHLKYRNPARSQSKSTKSAMNASYKKFKN